MNNTTTHSDQTHGNSPIVQTLNPSSHKNQESDSLQLELINLPNTKNLIPTKDSMLNFTCDNDKSTLTGPKVRGSSCLQDLLFIKCYFCNYMTNNIDIIIIRKTGRKLFRIETNCDQCGKFKSKVFCDTFNKLPYELYNIIPNKLYVLEHLINL